MAVEKLTASENSSIASRVREEIARQRLSRERLAAAAKVSVSTLEKGLSGQRPFTLATLVRLETALGLTLRISQPEGLRDGPIAQLAAPDELGSYSRASAGWLEGQYLTVVPSFSERGAIYAYRTDISWSEQNGRLQFREAERIDTDFSQFGDVSMPLQSGHIYLVTNRHGQHRLMMLARPTITGILHGLLATLRAGRGAHLSPVAAPVAMVPLNGRAGSGTFIAPVYGRIREDNAGYADYRRLIKKTIDEGFAGFLTD